MVKASAISLFGLALALLAAGCLTSAPPRPKSWIVSAARKPASEVKLSKTARLGSLSVAAPFDKPALVVRRVDGSVAFDSYNVFASSPSALLRAPLSALLAAGCLTSAPPRPKSWIVSAARKPASEVKLSKTARLGSLSVAAPFDKPALVVRRVDGSVAFDSYNVFASSPSALLRAPLSALLADDGRFGRILSSSTAARVDSTLEAVVTDLSLDCREDGQRIARVSISIAVIEQREVKMFIDGEGSADAASGDYSAAFSSAFAQAVAAALASMPETQKK